MCKYIVTFLLSSIMCAQAWAADEFDAIKCGADIPKAMVGKHARNERVQMLEKRHIALGLKDLGGVEISDRLFVTSWRICGSEYVVLMNTKKDLVRDVMPLPAHSLRSPLSYFEECKVGNKKLLNNKKLPAAVLAILDNYQKQKPKSYSEELMLPATIAWKIDEYQERFVPMPTLGLSCAVSGGSEDVK